MDPRRRAFYEYHAAMIEPWDGPAAIAFTDGKQIGATLDRNGLRPARYIVTDDDLVVMASESGVLPIPEHRIVRKWRLQPGKMFLIDFEQGRIVDDEELKNQFAFAKPYRQWIETVRIRLDSIAAKGEIGSFKESLLDRQQAFGTTQEDIKFLMSPMAAMGEEGTGSMGNDSPLAVLSDKNKPLYHYFKQLFAQVTNPPIDPIREAIVMSLNSFIGPKPNLLDINAVNPPMRLEVDQPVLDFDDMARLRDIGEHSSGKFRSHELDICYPLAWGAEGIEAKLASLCAESVDAIRSGHNILIITDRRMDREQVAIPALLALSAVHHHLVREGLRTTAGLVVETASAREVHHFAVLAGYGAEAVHPYLALETLVALHKDLPGALSADKAIYNYIKAIGKGLSQDHVQDGREHLHVATAVRSCSRPSAWTSRWSRSTSAARPRRSAASACSRWPKRRSACTAPPSATTRCWPTCSTPAASTPGACAAKSTCGRRMPSPSCSTARARASSRPTRNTRRSSTTRASVT